jgi:hypothetical protein
MTRTLIAIFLCIILKISSVTAAETPSKNEEIYLKCKSEKDNQIIVFSLDDKKKKINFSNVEVKIISYSSVKVNFTARGEVKEKDGKSHNPKRFFTENLILDRITGTLTYYIEDSYNPTKQMPEYVYFNCYKVTDKI